MGHQPGDSAIVMVGSTLQTNNSTAVTVDNFLGRSKYPVTSLRVVMSSPDLTCQLSHDSLFEDLIKNSDKIFDPSLCDVCYLILCLRMWYQNAVEDLTWICNSVMKISFDQSSKVMSAPALFYRWCPQRCPHNNRSGVIVTAGPCGPGSRNTLDGQSVNIDKLGPPGGNANISWIPDWFICFDQTNWYLSLSCANI